MSSFSTAKPKKMNPLDRVIRKNPKYEHIQSTLDTGASLSKYLRKIDEIKQNYRYQQDEIFKRMKITTFVQLLLQVAEVDSVEKDSRIDMESQRSNYNNQNNSVMSKNANHLQMITDRLSPAPSLALTDTDFGGGLQQPSSRHSTLQSVIRGIGEMDIFEREKAARKFANAERNLNKLQQDIDLPYLLLDIRDRDDYNQCHMITALHYPTAMLSRSVNNETPELLAYKNQPGKIIVIYDDDERIAPKAATTLVERGYDNLFLLSGGLKLAFKKFPQGLLTGLVPEYYTLPTPTPNRSRAAANDKPTSRGALVSAMSNATNMSSMSSATKRTFDRDDVEKLNQYLDENLMPQDQASRMSRSAKTNNNSSSSRYSTAGSLASIRSNSNSIHEKPWKPP